MKGEQAAWLIHIRAYPDLPQTFATIDDFGMSRDLQRLPCKDDPSVFLVPNAVYPVTLLMDALDSQHRRCCIQASWCSVTRSAVIETAVTYMLESRFLRT